MHAIEDHAHVVHLPAVRHVAATTARHLLEAFLIPLGLFYVALAEGGLRWALMAGMAWSGAAIGWRLATKRRVPGLLVLATGLFAVRTAISLLTGSAFIYFLQPTLGTFLVAGLFLFSLRGAQPLAERLSQDFCPLPESLLRREAVRRFFHHISLFWAVVYLINGATTLVLLFSYSLRTFLLARAICSALLTAGAVAMSYIWFRHSMAREGMVLRWAKVPATTRRRVGSGTSRP